jgi:hypothetical protein
MILNNIGFLKEMLMKKKVINLGMILSASLVMAGGNLAPVTPVVEEISAPCKAEGVYVDPQTHLMWQDAPYTDAEDGAFARDRSTGKAGSLRYAVNYCNRLNYAGYSDWRLPTMDELMEVHRIEGQVFANFRDKDFWTSTPTTEGKYYSVYPADAYPYKTRENKTRFIRCVRCAAEK